jgi:hypothetical protein
MKETIDQFLPPWGARLAASCPPQDYELFLKTIEETAMNAPQNEILNELSRYQYQPGINPFGFKLTATTLEGKYEEIQQRLAEREAEAAAFRARMMAQYR